MTAPRPNGHEPTRCPDPGAVLRRIGVGIIASMLLLAGCEGGENALARGDRLWADSDLTGALAEYRLAVRRSDSDTDALARLAHAYARTGDLRGAREAYERLLDRAPEYRDQAAYDFLRLAQRARERGDRFGTVEAVEAALSARPEVVPADMVLRLAREYGRREAADRAIEYYRRALADVPTDSVPRLLYEIGVLRAAQDDCEAALDYFQAYRRQAPAGDLANEARWNAGNCAFTLAERARREGDVTLALDYTSTVLELGVPEGVQDRAWFLRGEVLYELGRNEEALNAYRQVLQLNPARTGQLVERAEERIDAIRFGRDGNTMDEDV